MPTKEKPLDLIKVTIVARTPQPLGAKKVKIPARACHMGNFSGDRPRNFQVSRPMVVNSRNVDRQLRRLRPTIETDVADVLSGQPDRKLHVRVEFDTRPDDWPRQIIEQTEPLRRLALAVAGLRLLKTRLAVDRRRQFEDRVRAFLASKRDELEGLLEHFDKQNTTEPKEGGP